MKSSFESRNFLPQAYRRKRRKGREKYLKRCQWCPRIFQGKSTAEHCSDRCRAAAWRAKRARRLQELEALAREVGLREVGLRPEDLACNSNS